MLNRFYRVVRSLYNGADYRLRRSAGFVNSKITGSRRRFPSRRLAPPETMRNAFDSFYKNPEYAAWEIGAPQPEFVKLGEAGEITGDVLDVGCGSGEQAIYAATLGCHAVGVDFSEVAVVLAQKRAEERGSTAEFVVGDVRELKTLGRSFDTVLDAGTFHTLDNSSRELYAESLWNVLRPEGSLFLLCLCEFEGDSPGARLVTQHEIREVFSQANGYRVVWCREAVEHLSDQPTLRLSGKRVVENGKAWLAKIVRLPKKRDLLRS